MNVKNVKKFSVILTILFFTGLTGLFISIVEFNANYTKNLAKITTLKNNLDNSRKLLVKRDSQLEKYGLLRFKSRMLTSRFPRFSMILDSVYNRSIQYNFKPELVLSIIKVESNFEPSAVSHRGAYGLMQINLNVWEKELNINKNIIFDIDYNINLGLQVLKRYYDETNGDLRRAIHLYNNGYKYNNLEYVKKVDTVLFTFSPDNFSLRKAAPLN